MQIRFSSCIQNNSFDLLPAFQKIIDDPKNGFFNYTLHSDWEKDWKLCQKIEKDFNHKKNFVHVGMGGSILGAQMLVENLAPKSDRSFYFWDNVDATLIQKTLHKINPQNTLFYLVSKSGNTIETLALFSVITHWLQSHQIPSSAWKEYLIVATDSHAGELFQLAQKWSLTLLSLPASVGGRYSALTCVGMLPSAFAKIDFPLLVQGAQDFQKKIFHADDLLWQTHAFLWDLKKKGVSQTAFMPYSSSLKIFAQWFSQLWGESLGKNATGLTPLVSCGATDQHSLLQLFLGGPSDKAIIFLEVHQSPDDLSLKNNFEPELLKLISPFSLHELLNLELHSTMQAFDSLKRPYLHMQIPRLDEYSIGYLVLFFESLTVLMGISLGINPFDQPLVEIGKNYLLSSLKKDKISSYE